MAQGVQHSLYEAEGVYSQRIRESISLFYWVEAILFLPAKLAQYVGAPAGSWIGHAANIVVWFVIVAGFVFSLPDFQDARTAFSALLEGIGKWVSSLF